MKKLILNITLIILILIMFFYAEAYCNDNDKLNDFDIYGNWKIVKFTSGYISAISEAAAEKLSKDTIVLRPNYACVMKNICKKPYYKFRIEDSNTYFYSNNRVNKAILNIKKDSINIIEICCSCAPNYFNENSPEFDYDFIIIQNDLMIFNYQGFYFYIKKIKDDVKLK